MRTIPATQLSRKGSDELLRLLADLLLPHLRAGLAGAGADDRLFHSDLPKTLQRRVRERCARGEFASARKIGNKWSIERGEFSAWIDSHPHAAANDTETDVNDLDAAFGVQKAGGK